MEDKLYRFEKWENTDDQKRRRFIDNIRTFVEILENDVICTDHIDHNDNCPELTNLVLCEIPKESEQKMNEETEKTEKTELAACPKCGKNDHVVEYEGIAGEFKTFQIGCESCNLYTKVYVVYRDRALENWQQISEINKQNFKPGDKTSTDLVPDGVCFEVNSRDIKGVFRKDNGDYIAWVNDHTWRGRYESFFTFEQCCTIVENPEKAKEKTELEQRKQELEAELAEVVGELEGME